MRVLNKQKLEKEIKSLFKRLQDDGAEGLTEARFNAALSRVLESHEWVLNEKNNRLVSVLISDIRGFSYLVEKVGSGKITTVLNEYVSAMVAIIDRYGGIVDKFMGDSIIAFFEHDGNVSEGVTDVLNCALEMQIAMDDVNHKSRELGLDSLYMGIGINTGEVVACVLGSDIYREYTVIGSHVNLASRIEAYTLRGQILISENTYQFAEGAIETGELNVVNAKGMRDPLRFFALNAVNKPRRLELPQRESRRAPRIRVRLPVYYQLLEGKNVLPEVYEGQVVDISYGGMLINAKQPINQFSDIKMQVTLLPFRSEPVDIYAKALYVQKRDKGAEVGLEFTIIDDATSAVVKDFVNHLI